MATRSAIGIRLNNGKIKAVYCHYDGYPEGVGKTLLEHYDGKTNATKLISLGDMSSLDKYMTKPAGHSFNKPVDGYSVFYGRDRGEKNTKAKIYDSVEDIFDKLGSEYVYVLENNQWMYASEDNQKLRPLIDNMATGGSMYAKGGNVPKTYIIGSDIAENYDYDLESLKEEFLPFVNNSNQSEKTYEEGNDFEFAIARGDDFPNAIIITNQNLLKKLLANKEAIYFLKNLKGDGEYAKGGRVSVKAKTKTGQPFFREYDSYEDALEDLDQEHFDYLDRDSIRYFSEDDKMIFGNGGEISSVEEWVGNDYTSEQIEMVLDALEKADFDFPEDTRVEGAKSPEQEAKMTAELTNDLYHEVKEYCTLDEQAVKEILWGVIHASKNRKNVFSKARNFDRMGNIANGHDLATVKAKLRLLVKDWMKDGFEKPEIIDYIAEIINEM